MSITKRVSGYGNPGIFWLKIRDRPLHTFPVMKGRVSRMTKEERELREAVILDHFHHEMQDPKVIEEDIQRLKKEIARLEGKERG